MEFSCNTCIIIQKVHTMTTQSYDIKLLGHSNHKILECPETYFSAGISGTMGQYGF